MISRWRNASISSIVWCTCGGGTSAQRLGFFFQAKRMEARLTHLGVVEQVTLRRVLVGLGRSDAVDSDEKLEQHDDKSAEKGQGSGLAELRCK